MGRVENKSDIFTNVYLPFFNRKEQNTKNQTEIDYFEVLNTENMCWEKGKYEGTPPLSRYGHTANSIGPHILIFGKYFSNSSIFLILTS